MLKRKLSDLEPKAATRTPLHLRADVKRPRNIALGLASAVCHQVDPDMFFLLTFSIGTFGLLYVMAPFPFTTRAQLQELALHYQHHWCCAGGDGDYSCLQLKIGLEA